MPVLTRRRARLDRVKIATKSGSRVRGERPMIRAPGESRVLHIRSKYAMPRKTFARLTGVSERSLAEFEKGKPPGDAVSRRLMEIERLREGLAKVLEPETIGEWLQEPNSAFNGLKPLEVIERGQTDLIWRMIYQLESGVPG